MSRLDEIRERHGKARAGIWTLWVFGEGRLLHGPNTRKERDTVSGNDREFIDHASSDMAFLLEEMKKSDEFLDLVTATCHQAESKIVKIYALLDAHGLTAADFRTKLKGILDENN